MDVSIDTDRRFPESYSPDKVSCFPSHSGQLNQLVDLRGYNSTELFSDSSREFLELNCFLSVEPDGVDQFLDLFNREFIQGGEILNLGKELLYYSVRYFIVRSGR